MTDNGEVRCWMRPRSTCLSLNSDQQVRRALTPLAKMLHRTGCAAVLVNHTKKGSSRSAHPLEAVAGSGAGLVAAARLVYIFGPDPKDPGARILAPVKSNIGPIDTSMEFQVEVVDSFRNPKRGGPITIKVARLNLVTNHSSVKASSVVSFQGGAKKGGDDPTDPTRLAMAEEWLTGLLRDGSRKVTDVEAEAKKVKVSWATVRRAAKSIEVKKERNGYGKGGFWEWDLADGHPLKKAREDATVAAGVGCGPRGVCPLSPLIHRLNGSVDRPSAWSRATIGQVRRAQ